MNRRGFSLLETAVAGTLLGVLLVVCLQLVSAVAAQRRASDQRHWAATEADNLMERIAARPWAELTTKSVANEKLSPQAAAVLPGAELKIEVSPAKNEPGARQIAVSLRWRDDAGAWMRPVRIVTWRWNHEAAASEPKSQNSAELSNKKPGSNPASPK